MFSIDQVLSAKLFHICYKFINCFLMKEEIRDNRVLVTVFLSRKRWKKTYESVKSGFLGFSCAVNLLRFPGFNDQKTFSN